MAYIVGELFPEWRCVRGGFSRLHIPTLQRRSSVMLDTLCTTTYLAGLVVLGGGQASRSRPSRRVVGVGLTVASVAWRCIKVRDVSSSSSPSRETNR